MKEQFARIMNKKVFAVLGLISLVFTIYFGHGGLLLLSISALVVVLGEYFFKFLSQKGLSPYHLFVFTPLLLIQYSSIKDFKIRFLCLFLIIYLVNIALRKSAVNLKFNLYTLKPVTIWLLALLVFLTGTFILYFQGTYLSGDEPHYIMITQSIVEDGDFNLDNNNKDQTYFKYLPIKLSPHTIKHQDKHLSYHMPGLSFILIPFYLLFNLLGDLVSANLFFRIVASIINSFFALSLFYLLKLQFPKKNISKFWLFFIGTFPFIFHSIHLYPEIPAAGLMIVGIIYCFYDKRNYLRAGLTLSLIPWFHVKYYLPLMILGLIIVYRLFKEKNVKNAFRFFVFPGISLVLLLIFCKTLYGSFSPADIFPKDNYFNLPLWMRVRALFAYFWDQRDGLLLYVPLFFLAFMGLKKKMRNQGLFIVIGLSYILFHAYTTVRGAYAPAGRPLIFVGWIFVIFILNYYYSLEGQKTKYAFRILALLSLFILIWLFYYPQFVYQPVFSNTIDGSSGILNFLGSDQINLSPFFPSFLNTLEQVSLTNYFWLIFGGIILFVFYLTPFRLKLSNKQLNIVSVFLFLFLGFLLSFYPHIKLIEKNNYTKDQISFYNNSKNFVYLRKGDNFRAKGDVKYDLFYDISRSKSKQLNFGFKNPEQFIITIRNGRKTLFNSESGNQKQVLIDLRNLSQLKIKGKQLIHIGIELQKQENGPFLFLEIFGDRRTK